MTDENRTAQSEEIQGRMASAVPYVRTEDILDDVKAIIKGAQGLAWRSVNLILVRRNWLIGRRIAEEELRGDDRAQYGAFLLFSVMLSRVKIL